jgi:hypothetical protein
MESHPVLKLPILVLRHGVVRARKDCVVNCVAFANQSGAEFYRTHLQRSIIAQMTALCLSTKKGNFNMYLITKQMCDILLNLNRPFHLRLSGAPSPASGAKRILILALSGNNELDLMQATSIPDMPRYW